LLIRAIRQDDSSESGFYLLWQPRSVPAPPALHVRSGQDSQINQDNLPAKHLRTGTGAG